MRPFLGAIVARDLSVTVTCRSIASGDEMRLASRKIARFWTRRSIPVSVSQKANHSFGGTKPLNADIAVPSRVRETRSPGQMECLRTCAPAERDGP